MPRPRGRAASSSNSMGWLMNISLERVQRYWISYSCSLTVLPGLFPRPSTSRSITESRSISMGAFDDAGIDAEFVNCAVEMS